MFKLFLAKKRNRLFFLGFFITSLVTIVLLKVVWFYDTVHPINIYELKEADTIRVIHAREGGSYQNVEASEVKKTLVDFLEKRQERLYKYERSYFGDQSYQDDLVILFSKAGQAIGSISLIPDATLDVAVRGVNRRLAITREENQMLRSLFPKIPSSK